MSNPSTNADYRIATLAGGLAGLATLQSLGLSNPHPIWQPGVTSVKLGNNAARTQGAPLVYWAWGFVQQNQRDTLSAYCPGASSRVYIVTPTTQKVDGEPNAAQAYLARMIWPAPSTPENPQTGRRIEFQIIFRQLVLQEWP